MAKIKDFLAKKKAEPAPPPQPKKRSKNYSYYAKTCIRSLDVGLRECEGMSDADAMEFLRDLQSEIRGMIDRSDFAEPFLDRAVAAAKG